MRFAYLVKYRTQEQRAALGLELDKALSAAIYAFGYCRLQLGARLMLYVILYGTRRKIHTLLTFAEITWHILSKYTCNVGVYCHYDALLLHPAHILE
jgi:hypothetical protein